jgi:hypothetical protein
MRSRTYIVYLLAILVLGSIVATRARAQFNNVPDDFGGNTIHANNFVVVGASTMPITWSQFTVNTNGTVFNGMVLRTTGTTEQFTTMYYLNNLAKWQIGPGLVGGGHNFSLLDAYVNKTRLLVDANGNLGIGTTAPLSKLHIRDDQSSTTLTPQVDQSVGATIERSGDGAAASIAIVGGRKNTGYGGRIYLGNVYEWNSTMISGNAGILTFSVRNGGAGPDPLTAMTINATGDLRVQGNIEAKYQDVAEWVPSGSSLAPGTVVVLNRTRKNEVTASSMAYDTAVAGVVSEKPGLLLGESGEGKAKIATTGRVRVRVDASKHAIAIGDLLVSADRPGLAMVSEPLEIIGMKLHRPGTILGKALEPLESGEGEILVLLSLQ